VEACDALPTPATAAPLGLAVSMLSDRGHLATPAGAQLLSRLAQVRFALRDFEGAGQAWEQFAQLGETTGQFDLWGIGLLNAATTRLEANRPTEALALVERLSAHDERFSPGLQVRHRREHGLLLARLGRKDAALATLDDAVTRARGVGASELLGPALASAGIWRLHAGEGEAAKALLEEAVGLLAAEHPESAGVRGHLETLAAGVPCPCLQQRLELDFTRAVAQALSPELVRVKASMKDGQLAFSLEFARQPTPEEFEKARGAFDAAMQRVNGGASAAAGAV
jgi:tetratricopeptide (TPR) repeat protein